MNRPLDSTVDAATLASMAKAAARQLAGFAPGTLVLDAGNGPGWLAVERAARRAERPLVPVPGFFSDAQLTHVIHRTGAGVVLTDREEGRERLGDGWRAGPVVAGLRSFYRDIESAVLPPGTARVTFTSGSTGDPKGVCLSSAQLDLVSDSLAGTLAGLGVRRHLCALPLAVLLEEVAGAATALATGAELVLPDAGELGFAGDGGMDPARLLHCLHRSGAESVILLPEMLKALVLLGEAGRPVPRALKFMAVGGARVGADLIERARALGLPVFEGYGLSECGSVVALNVPGADRPGSAGLPLPHVSVSVGPDGTIRVRGGAMLGYLAGARASGEVNTGDLGDVDEDGFIWIRGRLGNRFVTSYGRNVSPEWPESRLHASGVIRQAVVFGEAMPANLAVIVPARAEVDDQSLAMAVERANDELPAYARVARWLRAVEPFSVKNGLATGNGRPRREAIRRHYAGELAALESMHADEDRVFE